MTLTDIREGACWACKEHGTACGPDHLRTCPRHRLALDGLAKAIAAAERLGATPEHIRIAAWVLAKSAMHSRRAREG